MKLPTKASLFIVIIATLITSAIRVAEVSGGNFPFTMDQGRDMVDIRNIVVSHTPRLVGPTTSINGVLLGPSWYYFLLPAFLLGGGNPEVIVLWQILWYQLSAVFLWWIFLKISHRFGLIITVLYLFMPVGFNINRYFWNANAMPIFTSFFFGVLFLNLIRPSLTKMFLVGLLAGISMQIEAAFGVIFFPFTFLYLLLKKSGVKNLLSLFIGFFITLIPQVLFEIRHQFVMTKVFMAEFSGQANVLGERISFMDRLGERYSEMIRRIIELSHLHPKIIISLFSISFLICVFSISTKKKSVIQEGIRRTISFLLFTAFFYLLFPQHLKGWYVLGLSVPLILIIAFASEVILSMKNNTLSIIVLLFLSLHCVITVKEQLIYLEQITSKPSNDPSALKNELVAIDWAYTKAEGKGFKAYNYIPSVYDYNYHYLYWWYGTKRYGYQPSVVAYLPDQPEYIQNNSLLWTRKKSVSGESPTILITETDKEKPEREQKWFSHFSTLCPVDEIVYPFGVKAVMLTSCIDRNK